jgi:hypothetical protein
MLFVNTKCGLQLLLAFLSEQRNARLCTGHQCFEALEARLIVVIVHQVVHGATISFTEAFAEVLASAFLDRRVFIYLVVISIGAAMLADVVTGGFDALVKSATLRIAIFGRWLVPTVVIVILGECGAGNRLCSVSAGFESTS